MRAIAEGSVHRTVFAATRTADAERPSVQALLAAVQRRGRGPRLARLSERTEPGARAPGSRALSGSGDQTAAMASAGVSVHAATMRSGITVTGHFARCRTSWATLPSRARTRPTPRLPMTISSAR